MRRLDAVRGRPLPACLPARREAGSQQTDTNARRPRPGSESLAAYCKSNRTHYIPGLRSFLGFLVADIQRPHIRARTPQLLVAIPLYP